MAEAAVTCLLERVSQLVAYLNVAGAVNELRQLMDDLDSLLRVLANKNNNNTPCLRETERQIKEVVYDLEDTICSSLIYRSRKSRLGPEGLNLNFQLRVSWLTGPALRKSATTIFLHQTRMTRKVKRLRETKLMPMLQTMRGIIFQLALGFPNASTTCKEEIPTNRKDYEISVRNFVGFGYEKYTILSYIKEDIKNLVGVVSIVGMCGMGKTALAWEIYNSSDVRDKFLDRIWIHVSQNFEIKDMCLRILKNVTDQDKSSLSPRELIDRVREYLEHERLFLVMDGICSADDWNAIRRILPNKTRSSKVLITSCDNVVGRYASGNNKIHKACFMNREESWTLLQLEVFGNENDCPPELIGIGKFIAHKCDGLPLQIIEVGKILASQLGKSQSIHLMQKEWDKVSESMNILLQNNKSISNAVDLTYSGLPADLSECFLYMGVFPEDYEISAWRLTRLWIAEGFVQHKQRQSLEDTAMQNLDVLINKNLVMVGEINAIGEVKTCRVHNMIRRYCIDKAREQNLFQEIRSWEGVLEHPVSEIHKSRRICVHSNATTLLSKVQNTPRVRSLLFFDEFTVEMDQKKMSSILDDFRLLKVLSIRSHQLLRRVTKLLHLKYITLSVDNLEVIPKSLSRLWNLQTFEVDTKSHFIVMKANIWRLIWLRHLKTDATIFLSSEKGGAGCENLQTLSRLSPESFTEDVCIMAPNLKTLGIRGKLETLFRNNSMGILNRLQKLKLVNEIFYEVAPHENALHDRFSKLKGLAPNLKYLTLSNTFLKWEHMSILEDINTLEMLKLKDNAFIGIYWSTSSNVFPSLQFLLIVETDLIYWEASEWSFPSLKCLVLKKCENLNEIPLALKHTLDELDIQYLGKSAVDSAKKIKAEAKVTFKLTISPSPSTDQQSTSKNSEVE